MTNYYGFDKNDPDFWKNVSFAIWTDDSLTKTEKILRTEELVKQYYAEKRDKTARPSDSPQRKAEEEKARKIFDSGSIQGIRNKLGLATTTPDAKVIETLKSMKSKSDETWKALGLDKAATLKKFGIA